MPKDAKAPGTASPNRTDRNNAAVQSTDPGPQDTYGERIRRQRSMEQVPLPDDQARFQQALRAARDLPASDGVLSRPTDRPNEPITEGIPVGPGANAPSIRPGMAPPQAASSAQVAAQLPLLETLASRPDASAALRELVFRLRSSLPPDVLDAPRTAPAPPVREG